MELTKTIQYYFNKPRLEAVSLAEIEQACSEFPYFAPLQFLLLKKMQQTGSANAAPQWKKAGLFFPQPYYLHSLLQETTKEISSEAGQLVHEPIEPVIVPTEPVEPIIIPVPPEPNRSVKELTSELANALALAKSMAKSAMGNEEPIHTKPETDTSELRINMLAQESPIRIPSIRDLGPVTDDMPSFEPYHTIDYFASQGIKLNNELPKDKLGKQLKSFTEWIKTMKKLPSEVREEKLVDAHQHQGGQIEALAAHSIEGKEVLTETMAEVLLKQGNKTRALEIFRKLSLAYPDKSAYFATRIEQLNNEK